eukprot:TRINITY_DN13841_c0_g1_i13.p1 TRINITY_DN13841_c0_g1~~TRINITY_DN13841_c0_g1_i13.p1  ORF type:complete len:249 (+),score=57.75 TRINITY_DN13841_c0_g1_i13:219-965(+)
MDCTSREPTSSRHNLSSASLEVKAINVILHYSSSHETDIVKNLPVYSVKTGEILLQSVLTQLRLRGYELDENKIWYYSNLYEEFVCCGFGSVPELCLVRECEMQDGFLRLKVEGENYNNAVSYMSDSEERLIKSKGNTIASIMFEVAAWRAFYVGHITPEGSRVKYTLQRAAEVVGIKKKTLDDYLQQIKKATARNFDFYQNRDKPIGFLRSSVRGIDQNVFERRKKTKRIISVEGMGKRVKLEDSGK